MDHGMDAQGHFICTVAHNDSLMLGMLHPGRILSQDLIFFPHPQIIGIKAGHLDSRRFH